MIVDVVAVERELDRIQRELTHSEVRTSLFNLVVFSPDAEKAMANEALNYLLGKRAARVIHIVDTAVGESRLDVSARCFVDAERKSVCFQEIVITSGEDQAGGAPGSWVPLLVRDIPTYIIWLDTICNKMDLLRHASERADKLLIDTELSVSLGDSPDDVLGVVRRMVLEDGIPVTDFAFKRLAAVQRLVASAFDNPERIPLLNEIEHVDLRMGGELGGRMLTLWLADRLGWTLAQEVYRDRRGRTVGVNRSSTVDCDFQIRFRVSGNEAVSVESRLSGCADVDYFDGAETHPVVIVPSSGELLLQEVDAIASDGLYRHALEVLEDTAIPGRE